MTQTWKTYAAISAVALGALGVFIWRKKKRTYVRVGKIAKIYFFPVKSMKGYEVSQGKCTKAGLEANGLLDRAFMLISEDGILLSQRQAPRLALLPAPQISGKYLLLTQPSGPSVKVEIKDSPTPEDKVVECRVHTDSVTVVDCGDEVASWFQAYLGMPGIRLVRYFPSLPARKYLRKDPFYSKLKKEHPIGLQDLAAIHILSQASIDDLNSRIEDDKISVRNFRPSILVEECAAYDEDSWNYIKFKSGAELEQFILTGRCLLTTVKPDLGEMSQKEPLVTLRKYRIPKDPEMLKKTGAVPVLGVGCAVIKSADVNVGDDIFAVVGKKPQMQ